VKDISNDVNKTAKFKTKTKELGKTKTKTRNSKTMTNQDQDGGNNRSSYGDRWQTENYTHK